MMDTIAAMHRAYGRFDGVKCRTCPHLEAYANASNTRYWYKCRIYGVSSSQATDWRIGFEACGAFRISPEEAEARGLYR